MPNTQPSTELARGAPRQPLTGAASAGPRRPARPEAQPFLKWAGGKAQLLKQFEPFFPENFCSYCEPFVGGGAVFFHLKARFPNMGAALRDNNQELINCYQVVRDHVEELMGRLDDHRAQFRALRAPYYYKVRDQHKLNGPVERAARMIFLNKTCYNGLWRVNSRGRFNVPIGSYRPESVSFYEPSNLRAASAALQDVELRVQDFRQTLKQVGPDDFVYVDPPYYPLSRTANFTAYTREEFGPGEQKELAELFAAAASRGARLMLSNSDTAATRRLYARFHLETVQARRAVNCDGAKRGRIPELVALSYPLK